MIFLLNFLPDWLFYASAFVGGIGTILIVVFGGLIPSLYKVGLQVLSAFLLVAGTFFVGGISNEADWQLKVKQMEAEIIRKELEAEKITSEVVTKYVERIKIVEGKTHEIIKKVPVYITKESDDKCTINNGFVLLHDHASKNEVPDSSNGTNEESSNVKLSAVAETVSQNYGTYYQISEQLKSLQEWITKQKDLSDD